MIDRNLARGLFLAAIALAFGLTSLRYPIGTLNRAGPGLFPMMISGALLLVAVLTLIRSRFVERQALEFNVRSIGLILLGLGAFAGFSRFVNMTLGIVVMVCIVSVAASKFSWLRAAKISLGLTAVAFAFQKLLGLNLPLY